MYKYLCGKNIICDIINTICCFQNEISSLYWSQRELFKYYLQNIYFALSYVNIFFTYFKETLDA